MGRYITGLLASLVLLSLPAVAGPETHPAYGHPVRAPYGSYDGLVTGVPSDWSMGDIQFPGELPIEHELTDPERYILRGSLSSDLSASKGLGSWIVEIFMAAKSLDEQEGRIPEVLNEAELRKVLPNAPARLLDLYRNPLTGEWPRLNASNFSPGHVYIRKLSESEKEHFAGISHSWRSRWYEEVRLSDVYYMRIYGQNQVLVAEFKWVGGGTPPSS